MSRRLDVEWQFQGRVLRCWHCAGHCSGQTSGEWSRALEAETRRVGWPALGGRLVRLVVHVPGSMYEAEDQGSGQDKGPPRGSTSRREATSYIGDCETRALPVLVLTIASGLSFQAWKGERKKGGAWSEWTSIHQWKSSGSKQEASRPPGKQPATGSSGRHGDKARGGIGHWGDPSGRQPNREWTGRGCGPYFVVSYDCLLAPVVSNPGHARGACR